MEIHEYERFWIAASLLLIVLFIGTVTWGAVGQGITMVGDGGGSIDASEVGDHPDFGELPDDAVRRTGEDQYDVYVLARQFNFVPGTGQPIEVPADSTVTFHVTTPDVTHGFEVVGTNVNTMVIPGQVTEFTVEFDEPAEYGIICNEYCGTGHHLMEGRLVVVPEDEFSLPGESGDGSGGAMDGGAGDGDDTDTSDDDVSGGSGTDGDTSAGVNATDGGNTSAGGNTTDGGNTSAGVNTTDGGNATAGSGGDGSTGGDA
jgi:cytochrome c oxidase subunit 2